MEPGVLVRDWWVTVLRGILGALFGILILAWPGATVLVLIIFFGAFALVDGLFSTVEAIISATRKEKWGWLLIRGLLGILIGIIVLARPGVAVVALLYVIAIWLIASGFVELASIFDTDIPGSFKALLVVSGVLSIVVGMLLVIFPESSIWAIILLVGIYSVVIGIVRIILGFWIRSKGIPGTPTPV